MMTDCTCHPESERLLGKLGACTQLRIHEMVQRTVDHALMMISKNVDRYHDGPYYDTDLEVQTWCQDVWDPKAGDRGHGEMVPGVFVVVMYPFRTGGDSQEAFVSLDGCIPKHLKCVGPLFYAAIDARTLSGDFAHDEYWKALQLEMYY